MNQKTFSVALIGPESSGKSSLCTALSEAFESPWVPEYAREYLPMLKGDYSNDDVMKILEEQLKRQNEASAKNPALLFCDTEPINFKVWMEHVFGESPVWIDEYIAENPHNLYLLTSPDLPWESDPLRENESKGEFFFDWYKMILEAFGLNYVVIHGQGRQRTDAAINAVEKASGIRAVKRPTS